MDKNNLDNNEKNLADNSTPAPNHEVVEDNTDLNQSKDLDHTLENTSPQKEEEVLNSSSKPEPPIKSEQNDPKPLTQDPEQIESELKLSTTKIEKQTELPSSPPKNKPIKQMILFTLFSAGAALIQMGAYALFYDVCGMAVWLAQFLALIPSVIFNFTLNRHFTFTCHNNVPIAFSKVAVYYAIFTPLSLTLSQIAANAGVNAYIIEITSMLTNFVTEFLYQKFFVFHKRTEKKAI